MIILIDTSSLRRPAAGTQRWVRGIATALRARQGLTVHEDLGPGRIGGGPLVRPMNVGLQRWWYELGVRRAGRRHHADVLLLPANLGARPGLPPQVVTILDVNFLTAAGTYEPAYVRYAEWAWRRSARDADGITTISEFSKARIVEHLGAAPDRIDVVYPGIDQPAQIVAASSPHPRPYALYVGATERHKNLGLLIDVWRDRAPSGIDLVIVGQPGRSHDGFVAAAAGMSGRVRVVGAVADADLEAWYRHARVFVFPSLAEGFGLPPLEAMARSVPVVASMGGALPEVLGDAALLHDPLDRVAAASAIEAAAAEGPTRARLMAAGRARAAGFDWRVSGAAMEQALRAAIRGA